MRKNIQPFNHHLFPSINKTKLYAFTKNLSISISLIFSSATVMAAKAPIYGLDNPNRISGQYIVVLKNKDNTDQINSNEDSFLEASKAIKSQAAQKGFKIKREFQSSIKGFAIESTNPNNKAISDRLIQELSNDPNIAYIEADQKVYANQLPWGLDRINQRQLPLDNFYSSTFEGFGVNVYVIDTGIRADHVEFGNRVRGGANFTGDTNNLNDCNGHGSHVAGTIGGATVGVAKSSSLWSVRVLGCNGGGDLTSVIAGINWTIDNHQGPSIINMSLGGNYSAALNQAVENAVAAGITVVVAAGNSQADACTGSPASAANALTVAASDVNDARSVFSNWGACVDIFAPGTDITSVGIDSNTAMRTLSGTSMASPHVAGVAALYLESNPKATPLQVSTNIISKSTQSALTNIGSNSPNLLLHSDVTTSFFSTPIKDGALLGAPGSQPANLPWPSEGMYRVLRETANQFCKENGYVAVDTYSTYSNYGAAHKYYLYGTWSPYGGVAFQAIKDIKCVNKSSANAVLTNYFDPKRSGVLMGTPQTKPSNATNWPTDGAYGNLWRTAKQFCVENGFLGYDYFANTTKTSSLSHTYYNGSSWQSYSNLAFWEINQIRCFK